MFTRAWNASLNRKISNMPFENEGIWPIYPNGMLHRDHNTCPKSPKQSYDTISLQSLPNPFATFVLTGLKTLRLKKPTSVSVQLQLSLPSLCLPTWKSRLSQRDYSGKYYRHYLPARNLCLFCGSRTKVLRRWSYGLNSSSSSPIYLFIFSGVIGLMIR